MQGTDCFNKLKKISSSLSEKCSALKFNPPVEAVYNPLDYAREPHEKYLKLAGSSEKKVIFLGMNPGPWGMAQTGVPFGEIPHVRDWMGIEGKTGKPPNEHPKRPIEGFACNRSEVSGRRLWGLFRERFGTADNFFRDHYIANYCPLVFMDKNGANITPDKLGKAETAPLYEICDEALIKTIMLLKPKWVIGIGGFAKKKIDGVMKHIKSQEKNSLEFSTLQILHPSPASPKANSGWDREAEKTLIQAGVWKK